MRDLFNHIHTVRALSPAAATADNTAWVCQSVDRKGYEGVTYILNIGAEVDADVTFTVLLEESTDNATWTAVDDINLLGTEVLAAFRFDDDNETRKLGYIGDDRYTRMTVTPSANTGNAFLSVVAVLSHGALRPTANPPQ